MFIFLSNEKIDEPIYDCRNMGAKGSIDFRQLLFRIREHLMGLL